MVFIFDLISEPGFRGLIDNDDRSQHGIFRDLRLRILAEEVPVVDARARSKFAESKRLADAGRWSKPAKPDHRVTPSQTFEERS